jgi:Holliday junction resolvase
MQPEAKIGRKIRDYLDELGAFTFKVHGGPQMMAGLPDIVCCYKGKFIGIEVKQPGQNPTQRQKFVHSLIARSGGVVIVARSVDDVQEVIDSLE